MTYVWLDSTTGARRFVDDQYLQSCNTCGKSVSKCRAADCWQNAYELTPYIPPTMKPINPKENEDGKLAD